MHCSRLQALKMNIRREFDCCQRRKRNRRNPVPNRWSGRSLKFVLKPNFVLVIMSLLVALELPTTHASDNCPLANLCANKPLGYKLSDPYDCHGYILCHMDFTYQQYCAPGFKFVEEIQECILGKCPPCQRHPPPVPTILPPPTTTSPAITTSPATTTTASTTTNDPTAPDCALYEHGRRFPNNEHCSLFWECVSGRAVLRYCERDMWYDRDHNVCNYPDNVRNCPAHQN